MKTKKNFNKTEMLIAAVLLAVMGVLFIVYKSSILGTVIQVALTVLGVAIIVLGVLDLLAGLLVPAIVKIVVGIAIIIFGWTLLDIVLFIIAVLLIVYGVLELVQVIRLRAKSNNTLGTILMYAVPILWIVVGVCVLCGGLNTALDIMFIIIGVVALIQAVVMLVKALKK
jgi:hypothetical protein